MTKNDAKVLAIFNKHSAIFDAGHVIYTSGLHGKMYINKDLIYPHLEDIQLLSSFIAEQTAHLDVQVVLVPTGGAIAIANWTADYLYNATGQKVMPVFVDKDKTTGEFALLRGYKKFVENMRILVADDVLTTSGTINKIIKVTREAVGKVVGAAVLVNRGGKDVLTQVDAPEICCLADITLPAWPANECPMCEAGMPINTEVGKARKTG